MINLSVNTQRETKDTVTRFYHVGVVQKVTDGIFPTQPSYSTNRRKESEIMLQKRIVLNKRAAFRQSVE